MNGIRILDRQKSFSRLNRIIVILLLLIVAICVYIYNSLTPLMQDDYAYLYSFSTGNRITSVLEIIPSLYSHYFVVNGRLTTHFLAHCFLMIDVQWFNLINTVSFILLGLIIYFHVYLSFKNVQVLPLAFIYFSLFIASPDFGQSYLWITGSSNYLYGPMIGLLFLLPFRFSIIKRNNERNIIIDILLTFAMICFGLVSGGTNENTGATLVYATLLYCIYQMVKHKKLPIWAFGGFLGVLSGFLLNIFSPGTKGRIGVSNYSMLNAIPKNIIKITSAILENFSVLLVIYCILFIMLFYYKNKNNLIFKSILVSWPAVYFSLFIVSSYSLSPAPDIALRVWSTCLVYLILAVVVLYKELCNQNLYIEKNTLANRLLTICFVLIILGSFIHNYKDMQRVSESFNERERIIHESIQRNDYTVFIPPIKSPSKYSCYGFYDDISENADSWPNPDLSRYYGLEEIIKK